MLNLCLAIIDSVDDKLKFTLLYDKYCKLMFYVANSILNDDHLSEDALQEAFIRIAKNFHKIDEVDCPQTQAFVVIIVRNVAIDMLNKNNHIIEFENYESLKVQNINDDIFDSISYQLLSMHIMTLPKRYRDCLYLYHVYGYSIKEISSLLSISVENTKKRIQRARYMLREILEKEGYNLWVRI